jgi:GT2 family glycosyltransferase
VSETLASGGNGETPSLAIVIVSYNVRDELRACLQSVIDTAGFDASAVAVIDNGSIDGTTAMLAAEWPRVRLIDAGGNRGFAAGNNIGIRATESEYVLLLNPDTVVGRESIATLVRALEERPDAAAAGPRLVDGDGLPEISFGFGTGPLGELRQKVVGVLYRRRLGPAVRWVERCTSSPGAKPWISGACLLLRRSDLEAVGLLDERYFMYMEDVDLSVALRKCGRAVLFVPSAVVVHLRGRSATRNPHTEYRRRHSQLAYYRKHHRGWVPVLAAYLRLTGRWPSKAEE